MVGSSSGYTIIESETKLRERCTHYFIFCPSTDPLFLDNLLFYEESCGDHKEFYRRNRVESSIESNILLLGVMALLAEAVRDKICFETSGV